MNKAETQVELLFDVAHSPSLSGTQPAAQARDRHTRFREVLAAALRAPRQRRATGPTAASKTKRLESKKRRGPIKQLRRSAPDE